MKLIVGTRGSKLSLTQTDFVIKKIIEKFPNITIETQVIKTVGDKMSDAPLLSIKAKGIFEREIDRAVENGDVDFAVHSMKDVPTIKYFETTIVAVPKRESPYDVLVSLKNRKLNELPPGSVVGTGSPRREAQLHYLRPDLEVKPIRGNVDTRIKKLKHGLYDAIILAEAGLQRMNIRNCIYNRLSLKDFTPSPGQGALAIVTRKERDDIIKILKHINHTLSMEEILSERAFIKEVGGGCKVPIGAIAHSNGNALSLSSSIYSPDGKVKIEVNDMGDAHTPEKLGKKVAEKILKAGGNDFLREWGNIYDRR